MGVYINQLPPVGFASQTGAVTQFSDSMLRTTGLGANWTLGYSDPSQASWYNATGGVTTTLANGLELQNPTGGGASVSIPIICNRLSAILGASQFAECQITNSVGVAAVDAGPAVAVSGDSSIGNANGYFATIEFAGPNGFGIAVSNVGERIVLGFGGSRTWVLGDVIRIAVQFQPTQNIVTVFKNGVNVGQATDVNAARPVQGLGLPGFFWKGCSAGNAIFFDNWRGGIGTGS
jgi:hypothetical protein